MNFLWFVTLQVPNRTAANDKVVNFQLRYCIIVFHLLVYYLNLILPLFILMTCAFTSAAYIQVHFRLDFFMEATNMNTEQSDLGPYCLQYRQEDEKADNKSWDKGKMSFISKDKMFQDVICCKLQ